MDDDGGAELRLFVLGGFDLLWRGERVEVDRASQRVLSLLAVRGRPLHRSHLAGSLWPDTSESKAAASLRTALWRIRRTGLDVVTTRPSDVALVPSVWVDLAAAERWAHGVLHGSVATDLASIEPRLLTGELLPGFGDDWLVLERERIRQTRLHALEELCRRSREAGRSHDAVMAGTLAVEAEPLRESSTIVLIEAHLAAGNRSEAVRQFDRYREVLRGELGLEPSARLRCLVDDLLAVG
jgi:DNA-binding SARP family transcriptional activator